MRQVSSIYDLDGPAPPTTQGRQKAAPCAPCSAAKCPPRRVFRARGAHPSSAPPRLLPSAHALARVQSIGMIASSTTCETVRRGITLCRTTTLRGRYAQGMPAPPLARRVAARSSRARLARRARSSRAGHFAHMICLLPAATRPTGAPAAGASGRRSLEGRSRRGARHPRARSIPRPPRRWLARWVHSAPLCLRRRARAQLRRI